MHSGGVDKCSGGDHLEGARRGEAASWGAPGRGGGTPVFGAQAVPDEGPTGTGAARAEGLPKGEVGGDGAAEERPGKTRRGTRPEGERTLSTARPGGRMRRRPGGRQRLVGVRLSPEEEAWIVPKAAAEGVSVQRLLVESTMPEGRPNLLARRALYREFLAVARDLHGACVNLNQLTHIAHVRRDIPSGADEVLAEVRGAGKRMAELAALLTAAGEGSRGEARR